MSLETDLLIDRRRLKSRLVFWRVLAIVAVVAAVLIGTVGSGGFVAGRHVARLRVAGIITDSRKLTEAVSALADDPSVAALIVSVDSPGGAVSGGESLHDAIARVAAKKPVVAVMGGVAASAGYMICMPAARVFAQASTLTGSIGVILETGEVSGLLKTIGVTTDAIISGPLKDQPSFTKPLSDQGRAVLQGLVNDIFDQFVTMVADGRHMPKAQVLKLADGRAYTGRQALALGLVDQLGDETAARDWLESARHVPTGLPIRDVTVGSFAERNLGIGGVLGWFWKTLSYQGVKLDAAMAIWQP